MQQIVDDIAVTHSGFKAIAVGFPHLMELYAQNVFTDQTKCKADDEAAY